MRAAVAAPFLFACTLAAQTLPAIKPGDTCEALRATYGQESQTDGPAHIWKLQSASVHVLVKPGGPCVAGSVQFSADPGHTFRTRDGIALGRDTVAEASVKLKGHINPTSFYFLRGEGKAYAMLVVPPTPAFPYKSTYGWELNPAAASRLQAPPKLTDFTSEPVTFYSLDAPDPREMQ